MSSSYVKEGRDSLSVKVSSSISATHSKFANSECVSLYKNVLIDTSAYLVRFLVNFSYEKIVTAL